MSDFLIQVGERIRERRKQLGYTQGELAEKTGLNGQTIASAEHGTKELRIENLANICQVLETSTDYMLLGRTGPSDDYLFMEKASHLPKEQRRYLEEIVNNYVAGLQAGKTTGRD